MDMLSLLNSLRIKNLALDLPNGPKILSLFDDSFFTQCDFDIIDGKTRSLISAAAKKKSFTLKGSRFLTDPSGQRYQFAKPSHTLGCNPADKVKEVLSSDVITFATPTQALLLLIEFKSPLVREEEFVKDFLLNQPANIKKVLQWVEHDRMTESFPFSEFQLNEWNELGSQKAKGKS
jgi:hypothetical protein